MQDEKRFVIGIDQSYSRTGITVLKEKKIITMKSVEFEHCKNNSEKRTYLTNALKSIIEKYEIRNPVVIVERIRLHSQGFISENYIKATSALVATIVDFFEYYNEIPVYSVDTRAWKSAIVGTSKPQENPYGLPPEKYPTILYLKNKGLLKRIAIPFKTNRKDVKGLVPIKTKNGTITCKINDDLADSYCIAMYAYLSKRNQKLKEEKI